MSPTGRTKVSEGQALCTREPRGDGGLEGYSLGTSYRFERMEEGETRRPYVRVYVGAYEYETCSVGAFASFFQVESEEAVACAKD